MYHSHSPSQLPHVAGQYMAYFPGLEAHTVGVACMQSYVVKGESVHTVTLLHVDVVNGAVVVMQTGSDVTGWLGVQRLHVSGQYSMHGL